MVTLFLSFRNRVSGHQPIWPAPHIWRGGDWRLQRAGHGRHGTAHLLGGWRRLPHHDQVSGPTPGAGWGFASSFHCLSVQGGEEPVHHHQRRVWIGENGLCQVHHEILCCGGWSCAADQRGRESLGLEPNNGGEGHLRRVILKDRVSGSGANGVSVCSLSGMPKPPEMTTAVALGSISR